MPPSFWTQYQCGSVKNFLRGCNRIDKTEPGYGFSLAGIIVGARRTFPVTSRGVAALVALGVFEAKARGISNT